MAALLAVTLGLLAPAALADDAIPALGAPGWRPLTFPRVARHTRYETRVEDGRVSVSAESLCAASALVAPLDGVDLGRTPVLAWRWRIREEPAAAGDPRIKAGDDFAARVYVLFRYDPTRAGWIERIRHEAGRLLFGDDLPMRAMSYVWSRREPAGTRWDNPFTEASKMISLGAGPDGEWHEARADVLADHATLFGDAPLPVAGVALMSDSDQSCSRARADYADLRFEPRTPALAEPAP